MTGTRWERWAPVSGFVYAALFLVGILLLVLAETDALTEEEILSRYSESGNRVAEIAGFLLVTVGVLSFLVFLGVLRDRLRSDETQSEITKTLSTVAFGGGIAAAVMIVGAAAMLSATSFAAQYATGFEVDPNLARFSFVLGETFLLGSMLLMCVLVVAVSVLALRTSVLPRWFGWVGFAAAILALAEAVLLPIFVMPVWVAFASGVLIARVPAGHQQ